MGVKNIISRVKDKANDKVASLAVLSPNQVAEVQAKREEYLLAKPNPNDKVARKTTDRMMAASSVEIFNAFLPQIKNLYLPVQKDAEYGMPFDTNYNIRYFNITKWVTDKKENNIEKLVNVYAVLANEDCNIALVFNRKQKKTDVFLAVVNTRNADNNVDVNRYKNRLIEAIRGNFPGAEWTDDGVGMLPCLQEDRKYSVAVASNVPTEKSEKFISQTIEKLLDGIIPDSKKKEYTIVLLATPMLDVEERKLKLGEFHSGLVPYATWQTQYTFSENSTTGSSATVGVNVGASAGVQNGQNYSNMSSDSTTNSRSGTRTVSEGDSISEGTSDSNFSSDSFSEGSSEADTVTDSTNSSVGTNVTGTVGANASFTAGSTSTVGGSLHENIGIIQAEETVSESVSLSGTVGTSASVATGSSETSGMSHAVASTLGRTATSTITQGLSNTISNTVAKTTSTAVANTLGKAVTTAMATTVGTAKNVNFGANFGANFARSSTITAMIGKNEGITQTFENFNIKHALELLESQMKRLEQSTALGMWDFAAYVLSEDSDVSSNVANSYLALTLGEESYMSKSAVNVWRGNFAEEEAIAHEISGYLRELRHPIFALNSNILELESSYNVYPSIITATTSLSGKELAYSLNFPQKSVAGLPVIECAEFGRNVVVYNEDGDNEEKLNLGKIFHMNHIEKADVELRKNSLSSHMFITGSTGSGKSNAVYQILNEAYKHDCKFLVIEPAKGEYKSVFGNRSDVNVYGTNPNISLLLRINPFSFPNGIHILEHLDRLVEIFNVCWPMYAAMPAVLKAAIEKAYEDCGWRLTESVNEYGDRLYPCFADVSRNIRRIIDSSEYDSENKGAYKGALLTRLQSLANGINGMIFNSDEISAEKLFDENVIVDLSRVGSSETKSLIMGMLVLKLQEYRMINAHTTNQSLRHLTVLEEAHNILKRTSTEQPTEGGNLLGKSVEMITNAIAEMRTYGEGFIIVDQSPGLLDMAAIRNTNTKVIMRLPDKGDRELIGKAANLNDDQITELAKVPCGVGAVYQNEWIQPVLCKIKKANVTEQKYEYEVVRTEENLDNIDVRIYIAELLCSGMQITNDIEKANINEQLDLLQLDAYSKVSILKLLNNPPVTPRMTKFAPIMSALFPEVKDAIKRCYEDTHEVGEWTKCANESLQAIISESINDQVRRDIVQAVMTQYLLFEVGNENDLKEWSQRGGLR